MDIRSEINVFVNPRDTSSERKPDTSALSGVMSRGSLRLYPCLEEVGMEQCPQGGTATLIPAPGLPGPSVALSIAPWRQVEGGSTCPFPGYPRWTPCSSGMKWPCTWMQVPVHSLQRLQDRAQRLAGMCEILVMGSIFSGHPMLTWAGHRELHQPSRHQPASGDPRMGGCLWKPGGTQGSGQDSESQSALSEADH